MLALLLGSQARAQVVRAVVRADENQKNLLKENAWRPFQSEFPFRRDGEAFVCDNGADRNARGGVSQAVVLNQSAPRPILASVWSQAAGVGGQRDADYSLYLDLVYTDGEPLWGQVAPFKVGTHDWQRVEVRVFPAKPVKEVYFHMLLRSHAGKASFKQPQLCQIATAGDAVIFDGVPVKAAAAGTEGFWVRDAAADSDFHSLENGEALGLKLEFKKALQGQAAFFTGSLTDTTGKDRAVTLIYAAPVAGDGWRWLAEPAPGHRRASPYENVCASRFGDAGRAGCPCTRLPPSRQGTRAGPSAWTWAGPRSSASASPRDARTLPRLRPRPGAGEARGGVLLLHLPLRRRGGFRGAAARFYELFPEYFRCRTPEQGLWMPFAKISKVEGWEDFGFKFKEGNDETEWDDAHGILTFRYTEPMTWWMPMPKEHAAHAGGRAGRGQAAGAAKGDREAKALLTSGYYDESGAVRRPSCFDTPWCDGAVWSMNSMPGIPGEVTDFKNKWNADLREQLYGPGRKGDLDGEYIDSSEGYVTDELDFRRDHFAAAHTPLTFSPDDHKPAIFRGLIAFEYVRGIADDVHGMGKLMMANGTPDRLCWLAPLLDVMGTETDWNPGGKWRPMSDGELLYRRALCKGKPYCFLMNTRLRGLLARAGREVHEALPGLRHVPRLLQRRTPPTGHYFTPAGALQPRPAAVQEVRAAVQAGGRGGLGADHQARSSDEKVYVERFGETYLTVFNDSAGKRTRRSRWAA